MFFLFFFFQFFCLHGMNEQYEMRISIPPVQTMQTNPPLDQEKVHKILELIKTKYLKKDLPIKKAIAARLEPRFTAIVEQAVEDSKLRKGLVALRKVSDGTDNPEDQKTALKFVNDIILQTSQEIVNQQQTDSDILVNRLKAVIGIISAIGAIAIPLTTLLTKYLSPCP